MDPTLIALIAVAGLSGVASLGPGVWSGLRSVLPVRSAPPAEIMPKGNIKFFQELRDCESRLRHAGLSDAAAFVRDGSNEILKKMMGPIEPEIRLAEVDE